MLFSTCLNTYLERKGDKTEKFKLAEWIYSKLERYSSEKRTPNLDLQILGVLDLIALGYLESQQYPKARETYDKTLNLISNLSKFPEVIKNLSLASTYHQLGIVAQALREYKQARQHYQQALDIKIQFGDHYSQACTCHQLGVVAQAMQEYRQAKQHYQQALDIYIEFGDRYGQARPYQSLGMVAQELGEYEQARSHYQQALDIKIEFGDRYRQAGNYGQLGLLAVAQQDYDQAQQNLQQALTIFVEFNDQHSTEITLRNLARLYQTTQDDRLLTPVAQCLGTTPAEVQQRFAVAASE